MIGVGSYDGEPKVLFMIHRFNFVSNWVVSELVKVKSLKVPYQ